MRALLMIDIDYFKAYNDHYGHLAGDAALRAVAGAISAITARTTDLVARYGGEEFVVLLPHTSESQALELAQKICAAVHGLRIEHAASAHKFISCSIGVSCSHRVGDAPRSYDQLLGQADQALYGAKNSGRMRALVFSATTGSQESPE